MTVFFQRNLSFGFSSDRAEFGRGQKGLILLLLGIVARPKYIQKTILLKHIDLIIKRKEKISTKVLFSKGQLIKNEASYQANAASIRGFEHFNRRKCLGFLIYLVRSQIKQMSMRRVNNSKALYNFTKKQRFKDSTSTKDLDDSLEHIEPTSQARLESPRKKPHHRTQSCPSITDPLKLIQTPKSKADQSQRSQKERTMGPSRKKTKDAHRYSQSQVELQTTSNAPSISIQNLSSVLYRKNYKESALKKSGMTSNHKSRQFFINSDVYNKTRIEQQIKAYELNEQLKEIERKSKGINIKQEILQNIIQKFEGQLFGSGQELMLS